MMFMSMQIYIMCYSKKHATFGDVTKLITQEWVQQLYGTLSSLPPNFIVTLQVSGAREESTT